MPSSFLLYAQDFDGDGRRDIWKSTPDVFASIGNYLAEKGWARARAWGREVRVPRRRSQPCAARRRSGRTAVSRAADDGPDAAVGMEEARRADASRRAAADADITASLVSGHKAALPGLPELPGDPRIQLRQRVRAERRTAVGRGRRERAVEGARPEDDEDDEDEEGEEDDEVTSLIQLETTLRERLAGTLPGLEAQLRFMPTPPRTGWTPGEFPSDARIAAGLLLLYPGERGASIPLTVRASHLKRHAGQISLPGGATDEGETLVQAALREAHEEIGVDPARVRILGQLTPVTCSSAASRCIRSSASPTSARVQARRRTKSRK
jgi:hypothetical protein